jgi:hypothetical protein
MDEKLQIFSLINSVIMVANKFILKVQDGRARSRETYSDMQKIRNEALLLKQRLESKEGEKNG